MAKLLIDQKARVDAADYTGGATALMLAARNGSISAVETLVEAGAKVSATTPQGTTVLMQAVANGSAPIVAHLLTASADPNPRDKGGASALSLAASTGNGQVRPACPHLSNHHRSNHVYLLAGPSHSSAAFHGLR